MKRFMDGLLHIYDEGRTRMKMGALLGISVEARERLSVKVAQIQSHIIGFVEFEQQKAPRP